MVIAIQPSVSADGTMQQAVKSTAESPGSETSGGVCPLYSRVADNTFPSWPEKDENMTGV